MPIHPAVKALVSDMDALSPRDANAQRIARPLTEAMDPKATAMVTIAPVNSATAKASSATAATAAAAAAAQLRAAKDKDHPPPPPPEVLEPPSSGHPDGNVYLAGKMLGKGGFAVCYQGQSQLTRQKVALKIVKSKMPTKMEQKVGGEPRGQ